MTYILEKTIQKKVRDYAEEKGMRTHKLNCEGRRGFPDVMFLYKKGIVFFIEFKRPSGKLTALQEKTISELKEIGQKVFEVRDVEAGKVIIDNVLKYYALKYPNA